MDISGLLAALAANLRNRYLTSAQDVARNLPGVNRTQPKVRADRTEPSTATAPTDTYVPTARPSRASGTPKTAAPAARDQSSDVSDSDTPTDATSEQPVATNPDGTYYYRRAAQLQYELDLRFDLGAILSTAKEIQNGDTTSISQLAAAGFGLSAGFDITGAQIVETNMAEDGGSQVTRQQTAVSSRQAAALAFQSKNFALQSFYKESTDVRQSLHESVQGAYRRAVNKFALRFRLDNQFSFGYAERFNVQTRQVAESNPEAVEGYVNAAGDLALKGSTDLMTSFFDAVDGYLGESETALVDKVTQFFDQAAGELGFSEEQIADVRSHLTDTISGFFDRVQAAVDRMELAFAPSVSPVAPEAVAPAPEDTQAVAVA